MGRPRRLFVKDQIYHVVSKGHNSSDLFFESADFACYLGYAKTYAQKHSIRVLIHVFMSNHVHFLIQSPSDDLAISRFFHDLHSEYASYYNTKYHRTGAAFNSRPYIKPMSDDAHTMTTIKYILNNPVKAGMVKDFSSYLWSSARDYFGKEGHGLVDPSWMLEKFGHGRNAKQARKRFARFMRRSDEIALSEKPSKAKTDENQTQTSLSEKLIPKPVAKPAISQDKPSPALISPPETTPEGDDNKTPCAKGTTGLSRDGP